jgi:uncharacterized protein YndB with AHSA1/START domain
MSRNDYGTVIAPDAVRFQRVLPGPIELVWEYLTDSEKRGTWLASGPIELRVGGKVELNFFHANLSSEKSPPEKYKHMENGATIVGRVTRCEPPRLLAYTWAAKPSDNTEVTFELTAQGDDVLLVVTHRRLDDRGMVVGVSSGWHAHLTLLADKLEGRGPSPYWSTFLAAFAEYEKRTPETMS